MEFNRQTSTTRSSASEAIIDQGLRAYMLKVYNYMASGELLQAKATVNSILDNTENDTLKIKDG